MAKYGYPGLETHQREHLDLVQRAMAYKRNFDTGASELTVAVIQFLRRWLLEHVAASDRKFAVTLKARLPRDRS